MSWLPKHKIVVPVDFSDDSGFAVRTALEIVDDPSHVHAVHVLFPLRAAVPPPIATGDITEEGRRQAAGEAFEKFLAERNAAGVRAEILFGDPGLEIAEYAATIGADLIVIPSHGYHGVKRLLLGSVTERVIRHANCSVLVLRRSDAD